jgi:hypothetical protein
MMTSRFLALAPPRPDGRRRVATQTPPPAQTTTQPQGRGGQAAGQAGGRGQQPARDAQTQPVVGTGVIAGLVVTEGSGAPVRRARVNLTAPELRGARSAMTTDQGAFSFRFPSAGRCSRRRRSPATWYRVGKRPGEGRRFNC